MPSSPPPRARRSRFDRCDETERAGQRPWGQGVYRRRIDLRRTGVGRVVGELEDDFHHFAIAVDHDTDAVTAVSAEGIRHPWDVCAEADRPIQAIVGVRLRDEATVLGALDARANCTHLFDLAGLTVAHAARTVDERRFEAEVTDPDDGGARRARLWIDDTAVLDWQLHKREVIGPDRWTGIPLWRGFMKWALDRLDPPTAEAAIVLRRAIDISRGRMQDLDEYRTNAELADVMNGVCHAYTPTNRVRGIRVRGSARDFTDRPELLLADFDDRNPT